ncbi:hypothetical protein HDV06_006149 [Boothiomyces sp. JEL0866]|nr:hypothetical protein HDV06_006149 [Boothiomyces sp. JEL0866]
MKIINIFHFLISGYNLGKVNYSQALSGHTISTPLLFSIIGGIVYILMDINYSEYSNAELLVFFTIRDLADFAGVTCFQICYINRVLTFRNRPGKFLYFIIPYSYAFVAILETLRNSLIVYFPSGDYVYIGVSILIAVQNLYFHYQFSKIIYSNYTGSNRVRYYAFITSITCLLVLVASVCTIPDILSYEYVYCAGAIDTCSFMFSNSLIISEMRKMKITKSAISGLASKKGKKLPDNQVRFANDIISSKKSSSSRNTVKMKREGKAAIPHIIPIVQVSALFDENE